MSKSGLPRVLRSVRTALTAAAALALVAGGAGLANASTATGEQQISYLGLTFTVPADWPVVTISPGSTTCVRFDRHAVYLGAAPARQDCPAGLSGRTEALQIQPSTVTGVSSTDHAVAHEIDATSAGAAVTATYATDRALVDRILASAGLPAAGPTSTARPNTTAPRATTATVPTSATNGTGEGFDACAAPDTATMSAWRGSYTDIGIYIGGSHRTCAQPNLTAGWVSTEVAAGWHFIPMYIGPQALDNDITSPTSQGTAAADDAVTQASALGFGSGNILYYDMEAYPTGDGPVALAFEAAWSTELHKAGYWSGIYGSNNSVVADLVANYGGSATPDVVFDGKWDGADDTSLPALPSTAWANHQRVHQYAGNVTETHGGYQIGIDKDALDVGQAGSPAVPVTSKYVPTGPTRLLDTRTNQTTLGSTGTVTLPVVGTAGVPTSATAVVLNVTAVNPSMGGYVTVFPDGASRPASSNLNFAPGQTIANLVTVPITDGKVTFYNFQGNVDLVADLFGYYTNGAGDAYTPSGPTRLLDTRNNASTLGANSVYQLPVAGVGAVPADVTAVVLNVTVTNPSMGGYLAVFPDTGPNPVPPTSSNLNFTAGETIPNLVVVPVTNGKVDFYNFQGTTDVIADLFGYFTA